MHVRALALMLSAVGVMGQAHAGQYLDVLDMAISPAGFENVSVRESALNWDCSGGVSCTLKGPLSATVVFSPFDGKAQSVTSQSVSFGLFIEARTVDNILDPLGHSWSVSADMGKWTIGVDIASQTPQGADPQFASAYGRFSYTARPGGVLFPGQSPTSVVLGLQASGEVGLGVGSQGISILDDDGRIPDENGNAFGKFWRYATQLDGARRAYPSTTDVTCSSTACMEYKTDVVKVNNYFLRFDVVATQAAVPEMGSAGMMLTGLAGLGLVLNRRRKTRA